MQMEVFRWGTITDYIDEDMDSPTVTANHIRLHTLRHMRSLLGERRWRELWGGVDLQPEQHCLLARDLPDSTLFPGAFLDAWITRHRLRVQLVFKTLQEESLPHLTHLVWYTHPSARSFFWDVTSQLETLPSAAFHFPLALALGRVCPLIGRPPVVVGDWLEEWWNDDSTHMSIRNTSRPSLFI